MNEVRCVNCKKLLCKVYPDANSFNDFPVVEKDVGEYKRFKNSVEIQCPRCKELNTNKI